MLRTYLSSHPQVWFCTALLLLALPKVEFDAEGGPLNLMLALLNVFICFVQEYIALVRSHPHPLQHTSPQHTGLDVSSIQVPPAEQPGAQYRTGSGNELHGREEVTTLRSVDESK